MSNTDPDLESLQSDWLTNPAFGRIRLSTLILFRWLAVAGQLFTVMTVHYVLGFPMPMSALLTVIAASAGLNAWLTLTQATRRVTSDSEAALQLGYDLCQLMVLLALTGGLTNPFSLLLIAPIVIAVASLPTRWWAVLAIIAVAGSLLMSFYHLPLPLEQTSQFVLPDIYEIGLWSALVIAITFTASYAWRVGHEARRMGTALAATQTVLAREQRLSALGAMAAAAAHELGTPLATIQLTAKEMEREAEDGSLMKEDAELLVSQARRCRDILQRLSNMKESGDQVHDRIGLKEALEEAAAPLEGLGPAISIALDNADPPLLWRRPEMLYALGNVIENAVDFSKSSVQIKAQWDKETITVTVNDDGPGFPIDVLAKLGEPYLTTRRETPGGGGLGLGVFIAQTLTERLGGQIEFGNGGPLTGAHVSLTWPRDRLSAPPRVKRTEAQV